jgi:hypothetical protein
MSARSKARAVEHIAELAGRGQDLVSFWRESSEIVEKTVPIYMAACWYTLDPASLLITSHFNEVMPEFPEGVPLGDRPSRVAQTRWLA